jgi:hypothetical protein
MKKIMVSLATVLCLCLSLIFTSCETRATCKKDCSDQADKLYVACLGFSLCYLVIDLFESTCKEKCEQDYKI